MRHRRFSVAAFLVAVLASSPGIGPSAAGSVPIGREFIPPEHWSYEALGRFEALGFVVLPSRRPFTRRDVTLFARDIRRAALSAERLSARDRFDLDRLEREFAADEAAGNPAARYDRPVVYLAEGPFHMEADADLSISSEKPLFDERWWVFGRSYLSAKLHFGEYLTYDVRYRLTWGPERDEWRHKEKPSPRETSWNGLAALYERAYLVFAWKPVVLWWGREYADWGPAETGDLLVSGTAGSLDQLGGRLSFRRVRLDFFHAFLSVEDPRRTVSAHRLEFDAGRVTIGLSETALYLGRGIDPVYALPLGAFYANQYNERGDDNIVWSVDGKYRVRDGLLVRGSLLIDDFQFEDRGEAPDKIGFDVGCRLALAGALPATVGVNYRRVDIYTYTHRDSLKYQVTGRGDLGAGDTPLGALEGPDADVAEFRLDVFPLPRLTASAYASYGRRGEGNDWRRHTRELDPTPPFPSGVVEKTLALGVGFLWEFDGNSEAGFDAGYAAVDNRDGVAGREDDSATIRFFVRWDL